MPVGLHGRRRVVEDGARIEHRHAVLGVFAAIVIAHHAQARKGVVLIVGVEMLADQGREAFLRVGGLENVLGRTILEGRGIAIADREAVADELDLTRRWRGQGRRATVEADEMTRSVLGFRALFDADGVRSCIAGFDGNQTVAGLLDDHQKLAVNENVEIIGVVVKCQPDSQTGEARFKINARPLIADPLLLAFDLADEVHWQQMRFGSRAGNDRDGAFWGSGRGGGQGDQRSHGRGQGKHLHRRFLCLRQSNGRLRENTRAQCPCHSAGWASI